MITVTDFFKDPANILADLIWPHLYPAFVYGYRRMAQPRGDSLYVGQRLHRSLEERYAGKWVFPEYFAPCEAIQEILEDVGVTATVSEKILQSEWVSGRADLCGEVATDGRRCIIEVKVTLGDHTTPPSPAEIAQMASYAILDGGANPVLICMRILLNQSMICVYRLDDCKDILQLVRQSMRQVNLAA